MFNKSKYFLAEKECDKFPQPDNGGAVCTLIPVTNTQRCQLKCNQGYDFLERPNVFEECGPNSNWEWSYQVASRDIPPCVGKKIKLKEIIFIRR